MIAAESVSLTHADAANLNVIDKIVSANNVVVTLSGESFAPGVSASHFGSLKELAKGNVTGSSIVIDDYTGDGSVINLKQITSVSSGLPVSVNGDAGANIIQLSADTTQALPLSTLVMILQLTSCIDADTNLFKVGMITAHLHIPC